MIRKRPAHLAKLLRLTIRGLWDRLVGPSSSVPYRFLVKYWTAIPDFELAVRVLSTEYFSPQLRPCPLPVREATSILVLAPHQDDETIGAGGTLLQAAAASVPIHIVYVTDGDVDGGDSVRVRDAEAEAVCRRLGATKEYLGISNLRIQIGTEHVSRLSEIIHRVSPQVLMAPWLLDSPPKHRVVNHLLWLADQHEPLPPMEVWGYQVHNALYPNGFVDITENLEEKRELLQCFQSQLAFRRYDHQALAMAAWNSKFMPVELGGHEARYAEIFFALPLSEFLGLVAAYYFRNFEETYGGHGDVVEGMRRVHDDVLRRSPGGYRGRRGASDAAREDRR